MDRYSSRCLTSLDYKEKGVHYLHVLPIGRPIDHKKNASAIMDFLSCEIPAETLHELKKQFLIYKTFKEMMKVD